MTYPFYNIKKGITWLSLCGALLVCGCSNNKQSELPDDFIVAYGNDILSKRDLNNVIPGGLSPEDSVRFVKAYIANWIETHLISKEAAAIVDMAEINRLTEEYRRDLIMTAYRRYMFENNRDNISNDSIASYYEMHKNEFVLDRPMVKGTYLKVPDDARNLRTLKRLYKSDRQADIDRLEKEVLSSAIHYDYFKNKWVDWEQIELKIPEDFGDTPSSWLAKHRTLEKSVGGFTYLLYITDILPAGAPMPLDVAKSQIINRLINFNRPTFDNALLNELYQKAVKENKLVVNSNLQ